MVLHPQCLLSSISTLVHECITGLGADFNDVWLTIRREGEPDFINSQSGSRSSVQEKDAAETLQSNGFGS